MTAESRKQLPPLWLKDQREKLWKLENGLAGLTPNSEAGGAQLVLVFMNFEGGSLKDQSQASEDRVWLLQKTKPSSATIGMKYCHRNHQPQKTSENKQTNNPNQPRKKQEETSSFLALVLKSFCIHSYW